MLCALIMAGGKGTRFWPVSTEKKPKQFLKLLGNQTMIQMTIKRIEAIIPIERIFICTISDYVNLVKEQIPELPDRNIIIEPEGRNTAPCIILSAFIMNRIYKDITMIVLPADHLIKDDEKFRKILLNSAIFLNKKEDALITIGMKPERAETGYGYIKYTDESIKINEDNFIKVEKFIEKPNITKAKMYLKSSRYLWNGGIFAWKADNIINKIKKYCPDIYNPLKDIESVCDSNLLELINNRYSETESISIDYAVLEKSREIYVVPAKIGWDDIGTWKSIERYKKKDINNNVLDENSTTIESHSNIILSKEKKVIMIGVKDIMTIETDDSIYVVNKNYMDVLRNYKDNIN